MNTYDYKGVIIDRIADDCASMYLFYHNELVNQIAIMNDERIELSFNDSKKMKPVILTYDEVLDAIKNQDITYREDWEDENKYEVNDDEEL